MVPLHRGGKYVQRGRIADQESACEAFRLQVVPDHRRGDLLVKHLVQPAAKLIDDDFGIALDEHLVDLVHKAAKMISGMLLDVYAPEVVPRRRLVDLPATREFAEPSPCSLASIGVYSSMEDAARARNERAARSGAAVESTNLNG